jgi:hypothetical protein
MVREKGRKKKKIFWSGERAWELRFGVPNDWASAVARSSVDSVPGPGLMNGEQEPDDGKISR